MTRGHHLSHNKKKNDRLRVYGGVLPKGKFQGVERFLERRKQNGYTSNENGQNCLSGIR